MNINNTSNIKPVVTTTNKQVRRIFNNKNQSKKNNTGVILEFSKKSQFVEIFNENELSELGHNNSLKIMEYGQELRNSVDHTQGITNGMMNITEKYYKMIDELKEKYSNEDDFNLYKSYLDKAFDNELKETALRVSSCITAPFMLKSPPIIIGKPNSEELKLIHSIEAYNNRNRNLIVNLKRKYGVRIYNDTLNTFKNIRNYYNKHRTFAGITNSIISKNNEYMSADDFNNIYDIEKDIDKKFTALNQSNNKNLFFTDDIKNTIHNMNCSDFIKDMYYNLYELATQNS